LQQTNSGSRTAGLKNLKEIITKYPEDIVNNHMGTVIKSVTTMIVDIEKSVRKEAFSTLTIILSSTSVETIRPFFDIISSHLRCAMTHINPNIQADSLLMLDIIATYIPSLLATDKDKIFSHFLDMISRLRTESQPGRTLTVNMSQKTTTVKWRNQVLER
jgi:pre-rRNA-processing protein IPI1